MSRQNPIRITDPKTGKLVWHPYTHTEHFPFNKLYKDGRYTQQEIDPVTLTKAGRAEHLAKNYNPFTYGNEKLADSVAIFDLPAGDKRLGGTCGRVCPFCYAIAQAQSFLGATIQRARFRNLEISLQPWFVNAILTSLKFNEFTTAVRVHSSGDFYSQAYLNKWVEIAQKALKDPELCHIQFYCYTKRKTRLPRDKYHPALLDFSVLENLPNFVVIDSFGYGEYNYGTIEQLKEKADRLGFKLKKVICPCGWLHGKISSAEYSKMTAKEKQQVKICGSPKFIQGEGCNYCQTKRAQFNPTVFVIHGGTPDEKF